MGIASLVLGIVSLAWAFFIPLAKWIGAVIALIGIVLGAMGRKNTEKTGLATAGLACSIVGFVLCIIVLIACAGLVAGSTALLSSMN